MSLIVPHHDGSELYRSHDAPALGDVVSVFLRVPHQAHAERVFVRSSPDGEPRWVTAIPDRRDDHETWWRADVKVSNPIVRYRFLLEGGAAPYRWVNAQGVFTRDVTDSSDYWLTTFAPPPRWLQQAIVYQVFPDRFADSGAERHWPSWAHRSNWNDPVDSDWHVSTRQMFGGDLPGLVQRLGHIRDLGANAIYLTPFFPAESAHRYNASSFDRVDELLGGDAALAELTRAAHDMGIRVIGDLTTNHTGDTHDWFLAARSDLTSEEAGYYFFESDDPDDYVGWFGVRTLPKLDHRAPRLAERMLSGPDSVTGKWLRPPYSLDAWRIDVANMTGRLGEIDENHAVARAMRATMAEVRPDAWLVAEHCYDASSDLRGDGWHGTMNYSGFSRPVWSWLRAAEPQIGLLGFPSPPPITGAQEMVATMRDFMAAMPWNSTAASMTLLGSHDTARWRSVAGTCERQVAGLGMLMAFPGVPTVYYGDEVGLPGVNSDLGRVPMPWDTATWDTSTLDAYRQLLAVRANSPALQRGGLRFVHADNDSVTLLRECADEAVVVHIARDAHGPVTVPAAQLAMHEATPLHGGRSLNVHDGDVEFVADGTEVCMWRIDRGGRSDG